MAEATGQRCSCPGHTRSEARSCWISKKESSTESSWSLKTHLKTHLKSSEKLTKVLKDPADAATNEALRHLTQPTHLAPIAIAIFS